MFFSIHKLRCGLYNYSLLPVLNLPIILLNKRLLPVRYTPLLWRPLVALIILQTGAGGHKTGGRTGGREQVKKSYRTSPKAVKGKVNVLPEINEASGGSNEPGKSKMKANEDGKSELILSELGGKKVKKATGIPRRVGSSLLTSSPVSSGTAMTKLGPRKLMTVSPISCTQGTHVGR